MAIDVEQARQLLDALGSDQYWRVIKADDQHFVRHEKGHWLENSHDIGRKPEQVAMVLARADDQFSWHVRPMPKEGPHRLTMLDDATQATIEKMKAEGLAPTAVVETSQDRYQVWHKWPWAMSHDKTKQLLTHLQAHFATDPGANMVGHNGRLPGSKNWKRDPEKGIDRGGCPVSLTMTGPAITKAQATDWLTRFPVPKPEFPKSINVQAGSTGQFDFDDKRYLKMVSREVPMLAQKWSQAFAETRDGNKADWRVALRAVALQLDDNAIVSILDPLVHAEGRTAHGRGYIGYTIQKARDYLDVSAPGQWGARFDAAKHFPWLGDERAKGRER